MPTIIDLLLAIADEWRTNGLSVEVRSFIDCETNILQITGLLARWPHGAIYMCPLDAKLLVQLVDIDRVITYVTLDIFDPESLNKLATLVAI